MKPTPNDVSVKLYSIVVQKIYQIFRKSGNKANAYVCNYMPITPAYYVSKFRFI